MDKASLERLRSLSTSDARDPPPPSIDPRNLSLSCSDKRRRRQQQQQQQQRKRTATVALDIDDNDNDVDVHLRPTKRQRAFQETCLPQFVAPRDLTTQPRRRKSSSPHVDNPPSFSPAMTEDKLSPEDPSFAVDGNMNLPPLHPYLYQGGAGSYSTQSTAPSVASTSRTTERTDYHLTPFSSPGPSFTQSPSISEYILSPSRAFDVLLTQSRSQFSHDPYSVPAGYPPSAAGAAAGSYTQPSARAYQGYAVPRGYTHPPGYGGNPVASSSHSQAQVFQAHPSMSSYGSPTEMPHDPQQPSHHHHDPHQMSTDPNATGPDGTRTLPQCWEHGCNGRTFSTFSNLLRHQRERSGTAAKTFCPKCGAEFTRSTARNIHIQHSKCKPRRGSGYQ